MNATRKKVECWMCGRMSPYCVKDGKYDTSNGICNICVLRPWGKHD